jgi:hypothetical protein
MPRQLAQEGGHGTKVDFVQVLGAAEHHLRHRAHRRATAVCPSLSNRTISGVVQPCTPASAGDAREGAYQFCIGIKPPLSSSLSLVAPKALRGAWQAWQWPRPRTR